MFPLSTIIFPECGLFLFSVFHLESQVHCNADTHSLLCKYATSSKITTPKTSKFLKKKTTLSKSLHANTGQKNTFK